MKKHQEKPLSSAFVNLFEAMQTAQLSPPADLPAAIAELPAVGELPSPWTTWLLISIITHHQRQKWGRELLSRCLPETIPPSDDLCCSDQPVQYLLPGMPEWRRENCWSPNRLRHNFGTAARRVGGIEAARVTLGHSSAVTSEIYALKDMDAARDVVRRIG